ncbi:MAG: hypothetical protein KKG96_11110 [Proteobacteria bacterium]|nr:hypothetical protein [Pseudomonadota bacterium]
MTEENRRENIRAELDRAAEALAAQVFSKLMKFREEADYNPVSMFTGEDFVEFKGEAEIFAASVKSYLVAPPPPQNAKFKDLTPKRARGRRI